MNKVLLNLIALNCFSFGVSAQATRQLSFSSDAFKLHGAYIVEKIPLQSPVLPQVHLRQQFFDVAKQQVSDSLLDSAPAIQVNIGTERKQVYAIVRIPAFRKNEQGVLEQLKTFTLDITEQNTKGEQTSDKNKSTLRTTASASVLASGTWQKLATGLKGVHKIDYDFVKNTLGQSGNISSSSIRLVGNGGYMLYEPNFIARPSDLADNPIEMHDGGDGVFGPGDYFLFYATGTTEWIKDSVNQRFRHRSNLYSDSAYYFISFNSGGSPRIGNAVSGSAPTTSVSSFNDYALYEKDEVNLGMFGKTWWGNTFGFSAGLSSSQTFSFPAANFNDTIYYSYELASAAIGGVSAASFYVDLNGNLIGNHTGIPGIKGEDGNDPGAFVANSGYIKLAPFTTLNFKIDYKKYVSTAKGYLDFIEINARRQLVFTPGLQLSFRDWRSVAPGSVAQFRVSNANGNTKVWDVTNPLMPLNINGNLSGSDYVFTQDASSLHEYIATDNNFFTPKYNGIQPNQNLHGLDQADYIIVTHPDFIDAANKLADFHRGNQMKVNVASVDQVYNEFGSGKKDISAIRDFVKMFYDRAGSDESKMPKYLLLFGQASYDYRNIIPNTAKLVPTYETPESLNSTAGYCSDDFYALLDSDEDIHTGYPLMDIGVGRIPATNNAEALSVVNKIIRYKSNEALGPWRINNIYIGDVEDGAGDHLMDADAMYNTIQSTTNIYKAQKVYLDNMNIISTPAGPRCPDANKVINDNIGKGTFLINYSGHGSIYTLSSKRIVSQDDYSTWKNDYKMPILITATCDFSRFDNPVLQSAGEKIILKQDGGAIALVTTTQVVYATYNRIFNVSYLQTQFTKTDHGWNTFGDAFRISKNFVISTGDTINSRKFALLGDPALVPDFPRYNVKTDSAAELIDQVSYATDSIRSLGNYRLYGSVRDDNGNVMTGFNGKVYVSFFDKAQNISVKTNNSSTPREVILQNNIIYKGTATVSNGMFSFEFITPKDINYELGKGNISYYAENGQIDAAGSDTAYTVGGFSEHVVADEDAPLVRPFMNDSLFKNGGLTGTNSVLFAIITDKSGINVSGNFVGHDLTAILDETEEIPYVLNDYYETAPNTYQRGYVNFPIKGLSNGIHTLKVKAWDVFNNSGEGRIAFEVMDGKVVKLRNIYNYPNPFKDLTHFVFEHNHPNEPLKATINIYNTSGSLVRTIDQEFTPTGSNSAEITWDGTGNAGEKLFPGVYPYRIRIATEKNIEDLGYQKVILLR